MVYEIVILRCRFLQKAEAKLEVIFFVPNTCAGLGLMEPELQPFSSFLLFLFLGVSKKT